MKYIEVENQYVMQTYKRQDIVFEKANDRYLWDVKGKKYLDFLCGLGVCNLGHCNVKVVKAIQNQAEMLMHTSNLYYTLPQIKLAKMLIDRSFKKGKIFFSNSGAEANECALKIARKWKKETFEIITFKKSFHGRTMATLSATGQDKIQLGFEPLVEKFRYAEFNDASSVEKLINDKTCAVMIEPIQGEGGVYPADKSFLKELRELCDKHSLLLIFDEVQCGLGRTGKLFAYQYFGVEPDIITIAKSLANGLPIGATLAREKYEGILEPGSHGTTFGGNPVSCAAAIEVIKCMSDRKLMNNVSAMGRYLVEGLGKMKKKYPGLIKEVRGIGLMIGMELSEEGDSIVKKCAEKGLIINCTNKYILRFLPPLTITKKDVDFALNILETEIQR